MFSKFTGAFTLCAMLLTSAAFAADDCNSMKIVPYGPQTLQQIVELGLCRNPQTAAAYMSVESSRNTKNASYANYLPDVSASASMSKNYYGHDESGWGRGVGLSASWLIFDFGKREADQSNLSAVWRATGLEYDQTVQNYVYDVVAAYYGMLSTKGEVDVSKQLVDVAQGAKTTADKKFSAGAVAKADVLKADTSLAARELELQKAKGNLEIAKGRLLYLLSFNQDQNLEIADMPEDFGGMAENKTIDELLATAKQKKPELLAAAENTKAAWHKRNSTFLARLPSISATGSLSYANNQDSAYVADSDHWGGSIGLRASMPIFTGFSYVYNQRNASLAYQRAQEQERSTKDNTELSVWNAYQNYQTAQKVLEQTGTLLESATESEKVTAGMYKVGRATMLDWQTAQAELASAKRQNISAKYDLYVQRAALALAIGEIAAGIEE